MIPIKSMNSVSLIWFYALDGNIARFYRMRIAYGTAIVVMFSYLKLYLAGKIFGKSYYEKRIGDLHARNAERVKKTIVKLQGLFIRNIFDRNMYKCNFLKDNFLMSR